MEESQDRLAITYKDLSEIKLLPMNFKNHDREGVEASLIEFGFVDPIGINPTTGNAYDGNGRTKVLMDMRRRWLEDKSSIQVPDKVVVTGDGRWYVPTIQVAYDENTEIALAAVLNRLNERGGYDTEKQLEVLQFLQGEDLLEASGFSNDDLDLLLEQIRQAPPSLEELKEKHGSADTLDDFKNEVKLVLPLPVHQRFEAVWNTLSGAPDEKMTQLLDAYDYAILHQQEGEGSPQEEYQTES